MQDVLSAGIWEADVPDIIEHMSIPRTQEISMTNDREGIFKHAVDAGQVQKIPRLGENNRHNMKFNR